MPFRVFKQLDDMTTVTIQLGVRCFNNAFIPSLGWDAADDVSNIMPNSGNDQHLITIFQRV